MIFSLSIYLVIEVVMDVKMFCYILLGYVKKALDDGDVGLALLTDLSKAFDCLLYKLLICKLRADELSVDACKLLKIYFSERKQRVKLGDKNCEWLGLAKGVSQGSLMGPFIFNILSNDLILLYWIRNTMFLTMLIILVGYVYTKIMIVLRFVVSC